MVVRRILLGILSLAFLTQATLAESSSYHLKRLEIQTKAFLAQLEQPPTPTQPDGIPLEQQLDQNANQSTWAEDMVKEDLNSILAATPTLLESIKSGDEEEYSRARVELESLARRLRISTSPLELDPQQQASLDLLMLELEEASAIMNTEREQIAALRDSRRQRTRTRVNVGVGWGNWGGWGPWGGWGWGARPFYGGFYRPVRVYRRPYCR